MVAVHTAIAIVLVIALIIRMRVDPVISLVRGVGAQRLPYAMASLLAMVMPSIYVDVQVVLAAPVARSASPVIGRVGLPVMASALGGGIFAGYVFVIPGLAAISIAGLLDIKLGDWLLYGLVIGFITAVVSTLLMRMLYAAGGFWDPETLTCTLKTLTLVTSVASVVSLPLVMLAALIA
jgi:H+/gluconate symporter-like permease